MTAVDGLSIQCSSAAPPRIVGQEWAKTSDLQVKFDGGPFETPPACPSAQDASGPARYEIDVWPSSPRCSAAFMIAYALSLTTVSRALSKPGRVSYKTAEHVRQVAEQLGYRTGRMERTLSKRGTGMLGIIVADIANRSSG
jgi:hypothetical protein